MELVSEAIRQGLLKLTRIPIDSVKPELNEVYQGCLDWWREREVMGKDSMALLPYGMWWIQQQRGQRWRRPQVPHNAGMHSEDWRYCVYFGRPSLYSVLGSWGKTRKICLMPHLRRDDPNELLVFERGPEYTEARAKQLLRRIGG